MHGLVPRIGPGVASCLGMLVGNASGTCLSGRLSPTLDEIGARNHHSLRTTGQNFVPYVKFHNTL